MSKEELKKEAQEQVNYCTPLYPECFIQGYVAGAERRENKIADIKADCDYVLEGKEIEYREERNKLCADFENMKATLESKIAQLEQQIEKMKCCQNCKHCAKIPDYDLDNEEDNNIEFCEVRCHEKSGWELKE